MGFAGSTIPGAGASPVVQGSVYLSAGYVVLASSSALVGAPTGGTGKIQVRRESTGVLVGGLEWSRAGALGNEVLGSDVAIVATDWYTVELVGDLAGTEAMSSGISLDF